ncbi:hypothetical protein BH09ACT8_BH09ACT8_26190 [soil metagenome]
MTPEVAATPGAFDAPAFNGRRPTRSGDLAVETHGIAPIGEHQRYGKPGRLFTVWFAPQVTMTGVFAGTLAVICPPGGRGRVRGSCRSRAWPSVVESSYPLRCNGFRGSPGTAWSGRHRVTLRKRAAAGGLLDSRLRRRHRHRLGPAHPWPAQREPRRGDDGAGRRDRRDGHLRPRLRGRDPLHEYHPCTRGRLRSRAMAPTWPTL